LVRRWGVLWRPLRVIVKKASQVVIVCCKLHYFIIEETNSTAVPASEPDDIVGAGMELYITPRRVCRS